MTHPAAPPPGQAGPPWGPPPPRSGTSTTVIVVGVVLAMVVGLIGLGLAGWAAWMLLRPEDGRPGVAPSPSEASSAESMPSTAPELDRFYEQRLDWRSCGGYQCATLRVPLDYADPEGRDLQLAVLRVPAEDPGQKVGQLVVNPGGPGASGIEYAAGGAYQFGTTLARYYDIVGFDPRGVGQSTPLDCLDTAGLDEAMAADPDPDSSGEVRRLDRLTHEFGEGCLRKSGDLARHMSTEEAAKDMDILRAALGERRLDYLGASYGTFLGATYADLFPDRVGRMVLDGAIDPSLSNEQLTLGQARGFQTALRAYLADCVAQSGCPLGSSVDGAARKLEAFLDDVDRDPLPTGTSRELTEGLAMPGIWLPLYVRGFWPRLTVALRAAIEQGDGSQLLRLSDEYLSRGPSSYRDNSIEALYAVNCLDHDDSVPSSEVPEHLPAFEKASPVFGRTFAYTLSTCSSWPIQSGNRTTALHAKGAPPIVVIGTTRDPATPYAWAKGLAAQLDSGVLVSRDGDGHTGFKQGNACVDDAVETFLVQGKAPRDGLSC